MASISVFHGDVRARDCDLLILKHADGFYGVDEYIARSIGFHKDVRSGGYTATTSKHVRAKQIVFVGVGPLVTFDYAAIRKFGQTALQIANSVNPHAQKICMPIHGPGYGLDENEAFNSLVAGLIDGLADRTDALSLAEIEIVEIRE